MIEWSDDQRALRESSRQWHDALSANHIEHDRRSEFSREKWELIRGSGILRLPFDACWGGLGQIC